MLRKMILSALLAIGAASAASADSLVDRTGIGMHLGIQKLVGGDHDYSNVDQNFGIWLRRGYTPQWSIEVGLNYGYIRPGALQGQDAGFSFDSVHAYYTTMTTGYAGTRYHFSPDKRFGPYAGAQMGIMGWRVVDGNGRGNMGIFPDGPTVTGYNRDGNLVALEGTQFNIAFSIGAEYFLNESISLDVGMRYAFLLGNDRDNVGTSTLWGPQDADINSGRWDLFLGGTWYFGGSSDTDGDGIDNKVDGCPKEAEDFDGYRDEDGCPDLDNDGDGVPDTDDLCPDDAEDLDGYRDDDGCPDPDNDNDGVIDAYDLCPNEMEDLDGYQDHDGCPDLDNDGDGVWDGVDQCPDTPAGIAVGPKGCPVEAAPKSAVVLEGVTFAFNSADLTNESFAVLDEVVTKLQAYPDLNYEIQGHTDSTGSPAYNLDISSRRAETVKNYLIGRGILPGRLTSVGYGQDLPLASNETAEGRATNRRVEMVRTN